MVICLGIYLQTRNIWSGRLRETPSFTERAFSKSWARKYVLVFFLIDRSVEHANILHISDATGLWNDSVDKKQRKSVSVRERSLSSGSVGKILRYERWFSVDIGRRRYLQTGYSCRKSSDPDARKVSSARWYVFPWLLAFVRSDVRLSSKSSLTHYSTRSLTSPRWCRTKTLTSISIVLYKTRSLRTRKQILYTDKIDSSPRNRLGSRVCIWYHPVWTKKIEYFFFLDLNQSVSLYLFTFKCIHFYQKKWKKT